MTQEKLKKETQEEYIDRSLVCYSQKTKQHTGHVIIYVDQRKDLIEKIIKFDEWQENIRKLPTSETKYTE